jgi:hypothetical protein
MNMKIVEITMEGGVIQDIAVPKGVRVIVRDYDCEGYEDVEQDENGDDCVIHTWDHTISE